MNLRNYLVITKNTILIRHLKGVYRKINLDVGKVNSILKDHYDY